MPDNFQGNYFDGQSTRPQLVNARIQFRQIEITSAEKGFSRKVFQEDISKMEISGRDRMTIRFGEHGSEMLDVRSEEFCILFSEEFPKVKEHRTFLEKFAGKGWKGITGLVGLLIGVVLLIYFFVIPLIGDFSARFFPQTYEDQLGKVMYENIISEYHVDSAKTALVGDLVKNIDFETGYKLKIVVVDYDQKNAFAMPGGYIIVYSGIMKKMNHYPEMIGLLAHEVSHINKRHTLRSLFRSLSGYIFISVLLNDINGLTTVVLENLNSIKTLSFSRKLEQEADLEGLNILFKNKVDPNGMVDMLKTLLKEGDLPESMEFLSSHPVTKKRIEYIDEKIKECHCTGKPDQRMEKIWRELKANAN